MFWLGLLLTVCYVPGYTGASIPTQWVVLSIILPLGLWRIGPMTLGHKLFCLVIAYAVLSLAWTHNDYAAIWGLWILFIWTLSYNWGTLLDNLRGLWQGLAIGLTVSTAIAFAQSLGYSPVETADVNKASGLFFNSSLFGVICGLIMVGLYSHRQWFLLPPVALGLILSGSRGGIVLLIIGLICHHYGRLAALAATILGALTFIFYLDPADSQRLQIWGVVLPTLSFFGHGIGSFSDLYFVSHAKMILIRPEFAHNDILQLVYEFGFAGIALALIPTLALAIATPDRPALFVWVVCALFYFPLYAPLTAFIGLVMAGSSLRRWALVRDLCRCRRSPQLQWDEDELCRGNQPWGEALPMVPRIAS